MVLYRLLISEPVSRPFLCMVHLVFWFTRIVILDVIICFVFSSSLVIICLFNPSLHMYKLKFYKKEFTGWYWT